MLYLPHDTYSIHSSSFSGAVRNVYFPFDILSDTPIDVANEMVKELDITDWTPSEIADMIDGEISGLLPSQEKLGQSVAAHYHTLDYKEDDDHNSPFYDFSSCSSSQISVLGLITSDRMDSNTRDRNLLQGNLCNQASF